MSPRLAGGQAAAGNVAQYKFDEAAGGSTLQDSSGNNRNGTIVLGTGGSTTTTTATDAQTADRFWKLTRVDITAPVVNLACPADPIVLGASAAATWTASDEEHGSGLATAAEGSIELDTSSVGAKTVDGASRHGHRRRRQRLGRGELQLLGRLRLERLR